MLTWLEEERGFPPLEQALDEPNGLIAIGGDLSVDRLLSAYSRGIFPWFMANQPILWWSPNPRMVLLPQEIRITRSLAKTLRHLPYQIFLDKDFEKVICACAQPRKNQDGESWITPDMIDAYIALFRQGYAHSVEVWLDGVLVGGLYGVALGTMFFGESMFSSIRDASKIALVALARQLDQWGYKLIDCQVPSHHLSSMGAKLISRREFANQAAQLVKLPGKTGYWGNYG